MVAVMIPQTNSHRQVNNFPKIATQLNEQDRRRDNNSQIVLGPQEET
jgi:hypothetical protein